MNEKKLKTLMDFQHVAHNVELERLIEESIERLESVEGELSDDDLGEVNAAGSGYNVSSPIRKPILKEKESKDTTE